MEGGSQVADEVIDVIEGADEYSLGFVEEEVNCESSVGQEGNGNFERSNTGLTEGEARTENNVDISQTVSNIRPEHLFEEDDRCPCVGMEFESQEAAYYFYNRYAARVGFSVRKDTTCHSRTGTREVIGRTYCCSLQGLQDPRCKPKDQRKRNRADTRTGCNAKINIRKKKDDKWVVSKFLEEHNHSLVPPSKRHKLRSLRRMTEDLMTNYGALEDAESCKVGVAFREARNFLCTKRQSEVRKGDSEAVLYYLECQQIKSPAFFYAVQVDSEGLLTNFFWADARSRMDYHYFGDVVCFDTTYGKTRFGIPFVPIVGVNHHCETVIFGAALLFDESEESLTWLVKTWMNAVNGKQPKVLFTDIDSAIGKVVECELKRTNQRYCLWNIMRSAKQYLQQIITAHKSFTDDFSGCLFSSESREEFECNWAAMLGKYELGNNNWLTGLYEKRERWSSVYTNDTCSALIYTSQRRENTYFDGYLRREMPIPEFLKKSERALVDRRTTENDADFESSHAVPLLKLSADIEKEAATIYTRAMFQKFQDQLLEGLSYRHKRVVETGTKSTYNVWKTGHEQKIYSVTFDNYGTYANCSCQLFESAGYLCKHILKIFVVEDVQNLPPHYIMRRWTKDAKSGQMVVDSQGSCMPTDYHEAAMVRYHKLCQEAINVAIKGSASFEVYKVAMQCLRHALREVESKLKNVSNPST